MIEQDHLMRGDVALVSGASQGIGLATARALAVRGVRVFVNGRDEARLAAAIGSDAGMEPLAFDVADPDATRHALATIRARAGGLDILVCNVGQRLRRPAEDISTADFAGHIAVNLTATYDLVREVGTAMIERGGGRIVCVSSLAASRGSAGNASYGAGKAATEAMVRALAVEWGPRGVRINTLAPGPIATETNAHLAEAPAERNTVVQRSPLARWGTAEEVAEAVVFLCSPASSYVHGHTLVVDGGMSIRM